MAGRGLLDIVGDIVGAARKPLEGAAAKAAETAARRAAQPITRAPKPGEKLVIPNIKVVTKDRLDPQGYGSVKLARPVEAYAPQTVQGNAPLAPQKRITLEDLEGGYLLPFYGDRSAAGDLLTGVGNLNLQRIYEREGGADFMRALAAQLDNAMWASKSHIISRLADVAQRTSQAANGADVYGVTLSMAPDALDFASFTPRVAADILQQSPIPRKTVKAFDAEMASRVEGWPGLLSDRLDQFLLQATPDDRKAFLRFVDSKAAADMGIPTDATAAARYAVTDEKQANLPAGMGGVSIGRIDTANPIIENPQAPHSTYNTQMRGQYMGGLELPLSQELLFPDAFADYATRTYLDKKSGQVLPFTASHKTYSLKTELPAQRVTPQMVDRYMLALEDARQRGLLNF